MPDRNDYLRQYHSKNIIQKKITFNRQSEEDMMILDYLQLQDNFSRYAKDLIRADMKEKGIPFEYRYDE